MPVFNNILAGASGTTVAAAGYQIDRSLRFNSGDSAYLSRTPSTAGNRKTWTFNCWIKRSAIGTQSFVFTSIPNLTHYLQVFLAQIIFIYKANKAVCQGLSSLLLAKSFGILLPGLCLQLRLIVPILLKMIV